MDNDTDTINVVLKELEALNIIQKKNTDSVILNMDRLHEIGYTLNNVAGEIIFTKLKDLRFVHDPIFHLSSEIPKSSLKSYKFIKLYENWHSS